VTAIGIEALARAVGVEDPDAAGREVTVGLIGLTGDLAEDLRPAVGRVRVCRVALLLGEPVESVVFLVVDARAGSEQESIDVVDACRFEHVLVHQYARSEAADRLAVDEVDPADARGQVEHVIDALGRAETAFLGGQIDETEANVVEQVDDVVQIAAREVIGDDYLRIEFEQPFDQVRTDEPGSAGD